MPKDIGNSMQVTIGSSFPTYQITANDIAPVTSCFDIFNIANPATSTVILIPTRIYVSMDATAASTMDIYLVRRTAANTGGTAVSIAYGVATTALSGTVGFIPHDTSDVASQAVVNAYSVNPTYGAGITIEAGRLTVPAAATPAVPVVNWEMQWGQRGSKPPLIRPGQFLAPSFGAQTTPGGANMYLTLEWIEVPIYNYF
jgi:hypothetical protein